MFQDFFATDLAWVADDEPNLDEFDLPESDDEGMGKVSLRSKGHGGGVPTSTGIGGFVGAPAPFGGASSSGGPPASGSGPIVLVGGAAPSCPGAAPAIGVAAPGGPAAGDPSGDGGPLFDDDALLSVFAALPPRAAAKAAAAVPKAVAKAVLVPKAAGAKAKAKAKAGADDHQSLLCFEIEGYGHIKVDLRRKQCNAHCSCLGQDGPDSKDHRTETTPECRMNRTGGKFPLGLLVQWLRQGQSFDCRLDHLDSRMLITVDERKACRAWLRSQPLLQPLLDYEANWNNVALVEEPDVVS